MLCTASTRVATGGSVTSSWIAVRATLIQSSTASLCTAATRVSVRLMVWLLPAASVIFRVMLLSPLASATPGNWKLPLPPAVLLRPWAARVMVAPASALPLSETMVADVLLVSPASASALEMPKLAPLGAWVSSLKMTLTAVLLLPAASRAIRRTVCAPSAKLPPARLSSTARDRMKLPLACSCALTLVKMGLAPGSSTASNCVTPVSSAALPLMVGSLVMPSLLSKPLSFCSAALRVGAAVSPPEAASRTTVIVVWALLPAASAAVSSKLLLPSTRLTPAKLKLPSAAAVALPSTVAVPAARSVSNAPTSAWPCKVTGLALVRRSPAVPVSLAAAKPNVATAGACVSSVKLTLTVLVLPAASLATRRRVCAPCASVPPARVSSWARLRAKTPPACTLARMSLKVGLAPGSSAACSTVTPTASVTVPLMLGLLVMPSVARLPVSVCKAAASAGGVLSTTTGASRTTARLTSVLLPAASAAVSSKLLLPSTSVMPTKLKLPSPAAVVLPSTAALPAARSVSRVLASARPCRRTGLLVVRRSPGVPVSLAAAKPKLATAGAWVSSVKLTSTVLALPAASLATRRRMCAPCPSVPPARLSSSARLRLNAPPACSVARMLVNTVPAVGSSAACNTVTPTASVTVPVMAGLLVMPSVARLPVSASKAALSSGAVVSGMASRTTVRLAVVVLPAASATLSSKLLPPSASEMPAKLKLPLAAAVVLPSTLALPLARRVIKAPASVRPCRMTGLAVVMLSP